MRNQCAPLLPADVIAKAGRLNVSFLLNGLKAAKIEISGSGRMTVGIMSVEREMKVVEAAMTVEADNEDDFPTHVTSYSVKEDGRVTVIDGKGCTGRTYFGDLIMGAHQTAGFRGMVIGGCTRDRDGSVELRFPVYSRGFMPRGPTRKGKGDINTPITRGGVKVEPGDLVVGDSDGVYVILREHIETALSKAEKKLVYEENREKVITACREMRAGGRELPQLASQWIPDMFQVG